MTLYDSVLNAEPVRALKYKMDVLVVATTFFSLRMLIKTASRMLNE